MAEQRRSTTEVITIKSGTLTWTAHPEHPASESADRPGAWSASGAGGARYVVARDPSRSLPWSLSINGCAVRTRHKPHPQIIRFGSAIAARGAAEAWELGQKSPGPMVLP
jgi:hypothetical protein